MQLQTALCYRDTWGMIFTTEFFKSNINYMWLQGQPPPLPMKDSGCIPSGKNAYVISIKHCVVKGWSFCVYGGEII